MASRQFSFWRGAGICALVLFSSRTLLAQAGPDSRERESARLLAQEGDKKLAAKDAKGAIEAYRKAFAIVPAPPLGLQLASVLEKQGRFVEARQVLRSVAHSQPAGGEAASWAPARKKAAERIASVEKKIAVLRLSLVPADVPKLKVSVDGQPVRPELLGGPQALDPGSHRIAAEGAGFLPLNQEVSLAKGEHKSLKLTLKKGAAPVGAPTEGNPKPRKKPPEYGDKAKKPGGGRTKRRHDGFFFRVGLGVGTVTGSFKEGATTHSISSPGGLFELAGGYTVAPGLVLGGLLQTQAGTKVKVSSVENPPASPQPASELGTLDLVHFAAFVDFYPKPTGGFHIFASLGGTRLSLGKVDGGTLLTEQASSGAAVGIGGGVGYGLWIGDQWSLGLSLRGQYASTPLSTESDAAVSGQLDAKVSGIAVGIDATLH